MEWAKLFSFTREYTCIRDDQFESMRDDINSNTGDCAKLLYRLEEAEAQTKLLEARVEYLETPVKGSCT